MPKSNYDLNRMRKTYPLIRRKPKYVTTKEDIVETARLVFHNTTTREYTFQNNYTGIPVVVATPENIAVNAYISAINQEKVTIEISRIPVSSEDCDVYVHIQIFNQD